MAGVRMDRRQFFARSFVLAMKYFLGVGPLIGGFYLLAKTGTTYEGHVGFAILFFIYSYVFGMAPALLAAAIWFSIVCVISWISMERLLKMPLIFLLGSLVISGLAGYGSELLWERGFMLQAGITYSDAGLLAGCIAGFMAANGVLAFAERKNLDHSK
jgi:hypothetical protein